MNYNEREQYMKEFNYQDYLKYQKTKKQEIKGILELREGEVPFKVHQPHDKIFKIVLNEKNQVVALLNRLLPLKPKLTEDEIEKYNTEYINDRFQKSESDIVYRMKNKEIFFKWKMGGRKLYKRMSRNLKRCR